MLGVSRAVVLSRRCVRPHILRRTIITLPPKYPLKAWENVVGLTVMFTGCLAIPAWVLTHMDDYRK